MKISYGITVHNEADELNKLLDVLDRNIDEEDEIVVCIDDSGQDKNPALVKVLDSWSPDIVYQRKLRKDFSAQKNSVIEKSSGDYIFHIDADEYPNEILLQQLKEILTINDVDLIWIPRVNTVEGLTDSHIQKWGWQVNDKGWINFPDYQTRIYKNTNDIMWMNKVHERITGYDSVSNFPPQEEYSLYHHKQIQRQEKQNEFYETI